MREAFRSFVGDGTPPLTITQVELAEEAAALFPALPTPAADARITYKAMHPEVALRIRGTFTAPLFLTSPDAAGTLNWNDATGTLDPNGTVERPFLLLVPPSALTALTPPPTLIYGHGLLRSACDEGCVEPGAAELMPHLTALLGTVTDATDWWGLSQTDLPVALSGGEQQRVAVARALANDPSLILADEPTAALDSHRGRQVMELFAKVAHERNAGVLVVTHDHRTLDVFDRIVDVEDGGIKERRLSAAGAVEPVKSAAT
jgi:hypothetical protein